MKSRGDILLSKDKHHSWFVTSAIIWSF